MRADANASGPPASLQRRHPGSFGWSRPANERRAAAGLLAHGSLRFRRLPIRLDSGVGEALAAYSCGHSRGLEAEPRTAFPFHVLSDEPSQSDV